MSKTIATDALVEDVLQIKGQIDRGDFQRLVLEFVIREPELAVLVSEKYDLILTMLECASLSIKHRVILKKHLSLLVWTPLLLLNQAHRRGWDDFLPSEDAADDEPGQEGGGE